MRFRICNFLPIILILLARPFSAICQQVDNAKANQATHDNFFHVGWIWPDSMPRLKGEPAADKNDHIYIFDENNTLYSIDDNGDIIWIFYGDYTGVSSPVVGDSVIYFLASEGDYQSHHIALYAVDFGGRFIWKYIGEKGMGGDPVISSLGDIYVTCSEYGFGKGAYHISKEGEGNWFDWPKGVLTGELLGCDTRGNLLLWVRSHDQILYISKEGEVLKTCPEYGLPYTAGYKYNGIDFIYYSNENDFIQATDIECITIWSIKRDAGQEEYISHVLVSWENVRAFIAATNGDIYKLDTFYGTPFWKCNTGRDEDRNGDMVLSPNEILFITDSRGMIIAIDKNGKLAWKHQMYDAGALSRPLVSSKDDLFIAQNGRLYKFTQDTTQFAPQPDSVPLPATMADAENEIVEFMVQDIADGIKCLADMIKRNADSDDMPKSSFMPKLSAPGDNLIVYHHIKNKKSDDINALDSSEPVSAWLCDGGPPRKGEDTKKTIKNYSKKSGKRTIIPWSYGIYEFGIVSISDDFTEAVVLQDHHCGSLCGSGDRLYLQRSPSGKWWVVKSVQRWIS